MMHLKEKRYQVKYIRCEMYLDFKKCLCAKYVGNEIF